MRNNIKQMKQRYHEFNQSVEGWDRMNQLEKIIYVLRSETEDINSNIDSSLEPLEEMKQIEAFETMCWALDVIEALTDVKWTDAVTRSQYTYDEQNEYNKTNTNKIMDT